MKRYYWLRLVWVKLMRVGTFTGCHQMPERSFHFRQYQFPVCARCTGVLMGELLAIVLCLIGRPVPLWAAAACALLMLLDWGIQFLGLLESNNPRRLVTGVLGGLGCWSLLIWLLLAAVSLIW